MTGDQLSAAMAGALLTLLLLRVARFVSERRGRHGRI